MTQVDQAGDGRRYPARRRGIGASAGKRGLALGCLLGAGVAAGLLVSRAAALPGVSSLSTPTVSTPAVAVSSPSTAVSAPVATVPTPPAAVSAPAATVAAAVSAPTRQPVGAAAPAPLPVSPPHATVSSSLPTVSTPVATVPVGGTSASSGSSAPSAAVSTPVASAGLGGGSASGGSSAPVATVSTPVASAAVGGSTSGASSAPAATVATPIATVSAHVAAAPVAPVRTVARTASTRVATTLSAAGRGSGSTASAHAAAAAPTKSAASGRAADVASPAAAPESGATRAATAAATTGRRGRAHAARRPRVRHRPAVDRRTPAPQIVPVQSLAKASGKRPGPAPVAATAVAQHPRRAEPRGGIPGIDSLNPADAPAWLRPFLYLLLGASVAALVVLALPGGTRRRFLRRLAPRAEAGTIVEAAPAVTLRSVFRRFWPYTRPYRGWLLVMLALVPIAPALQTASILLFKRLVDRVLVPHDFGPFPTLALAYVGISIVGGSVSFFDDYLSTYVGERFVLDLRTNLFRHVQDLSLDFFERRRLGDVIARLTSDVAAIENLVVAGVASSLGYLLRIVFFAGALFYIRWDLAVVSLAVAPIFLVAARRFARLRKEAAREARRRSGAMSAVAEESFANVQLVQAFNRQGTEVERFRSESQGSLAAQLASTRLRALYGPLVELVELLGGLLIVGIGTWELARGWLTIGGLLAFLALLTQLYRPVRGLGRLGSSVASASAGAERIIELLEQQPRVVEPAEPRPLERAHGLVEVDDVVFRYPVAAADALAGVSFAADRGDVVAIVGPSGAGKSTLAKLLLRFYDPGAGAIRLDGIDLRRLSLRSLREQIAVVFQETLVFDASIAENVAYGRPGATREEVARAAESAALTPFLASLPEGLDTLVGQKGRRLSGGQRQRIAIARAFLRDAPVLLLDEPTTGLDAEAAARIRDLLRRLAEGRTTIVISHDLSLARDATRVLALDGGRVVESGTHQELLCAGGLYASLARLQGGERPAAVPA